jgi:uncharacterized membrane protein HdeD (DUF308 family)
MKLSSGIPATLGRTAGILLIILGFIAIIFPVPVFRMLEWFFALLVLFMAVGLFLKGCAKGTGPRTERIILVICGIAGLLAGLAILIVPRIMTIAAKDVIAAWAVIAGIGLILYVFGSDTGFERGLSAVIGLVLAALGLLMFFVPVLVTDYLLVIILGFFAIGIGILAILFGGAPPAEKKEIDHQIYK